MNFQNDKYTLKYADASDNEGINEVYMSGHFPGNLSIRFLRNPSPYESFLADGDESRMMVIRDNENDRTIAVGGAVIREEYVSGSLTKCAYLTGLKIHPEYQKKISFIAKSYEFLREGLRECSHCYTTILDDNAYAIKLLEKKRKNMPEYKYLGRYTTYCFHGGRRCLGVCEIDDFISFSQSSERSDSEPKPLISENEMSAIKFCFEKIARYTFSPKPDIKGLGKKKFYYVMKDGEVAACCFVGEQKQYKQYELFSYGGIYKVLSKLPTALLGYPSFPREGEIINHGVVSFLYVINNDKRLLKRFLKTVAAMAGYDLLIWGCFENHPLKDAMDKYKTVHYGSRLYEVDWEGELADKTREEILENYGTIGIEVSLL